MQHFGQEFARRWVRGAACGAGLSFWAAAAAWAVSLGGGLLFGGDRRVFGSAAGDRRARGEGDVLKLAASVEEAGGLRGPGGPLLGCLVVLTTAQHTVALCSGRAAVRLASLGGCGWCVVGESARGDVVEASLRLDLRRLDETGTLATVPGASSCSAGQKGRSEQHFAMCGVDLARSIGVLDTTSTPSFAHAEAKLSSCGLGWREGRGRRAPGQNRAHLQVPAPHRSVKLSLAQVRGRLLAIPPCAAPSRAAHRGQLAPRSGNSVGTRTFVNEIQMYIMNS